MFGYSIQYMAEYTYVLYTIPYTAKCLRGKTFTVIAVFHLIANVFPRIMALLIGNVSLQACYRESFPANNHFPL